MNLQVKPNKNMKPKKNTANAFFNWWINKVKGDYISHQSYENILEKFNQ